MWSFMNGFNNKDTGVFVKSNQEGVMKVRHVITDN